MGKEPLDEKKICFIICSNRPLFLEECLLYISLLEVPEGYTIDAISITDAVSMTAGYNEGMAATDAKYKVYLHQDVLILYKGFIQAILNIFQSDSEIGLIGMVGAPKMLTGGVMWHCPREGNLYGLEKPTQSPGKYHYQISDGLYEVEAVDGFLIATSQDICWREDLFDGWDFYDVSQSYEFRKAGYKVVVPEQTIPWCSHECDIVSLLEYNKYRKIFLENYKEFFVPKKEIQKVQFIICANNNLYLEQCLWHINQLVVPEGIIIDVVSIWEAESIIEAYNEGMRNSDAKYKIYLHQDTFILNRNMISDLLEIFQDNKKIGMIGVIGGDWLPDDAAIWNSWNLGMTYGSITSDVILVKGKKEIAADRSWIKAAAVDGMLIATQYDIEWRNDLGLQWDGYDLSQSLEFGRRGYFVVIPNQKSPWCLHDCGPSNLYHYDHAREILLKEYSDYFHGIYEETANTELAVLQEQIFQIIWQEMEKRHFESAFAAYQTLDQNLLFNKSLKYLECFLEIYNDEKNIQGSGKKFFDDVKVYAEIRDKYDSYKFWLRRIEFGEGEGADLLSLRKDIESGNISEQAIQSIIVKSAVDKEYLMNCVFEKGVE